MLSTVDLLALSCVLLLLCTYDTSFDLLSKVSTLMRGQLCTVDLLALSCLLLLLCIKWYLFDLLSQMSNVIDSSRFLALL
jgi:hypothetical protein